jgi:hypothetical protein
MDTSTSDHYRRILSELQAARGESNGAFGRVLAQTIAPERQAFSKQYVDMLKRGKSAITPEIARALDVLGAMLDGQSELQARARTYTVLAMHDLPAHTIVLGRPRPCELAGCRIVFVPASPRQRFCSPECGREARRRRRLTTDAHRL